MRQPKTYRAWVKQQGKTEELGAKALLANRILRKLDKAKIPDMIAPPIAKAISQGLIDNGVRLPPSLELWTEKDQSLRATEYGVILEGIQGNLPIEYLSMAYHAWQKGYDEIQAWEHKSLIEYLAYWWFKAKGQKRLKKRVEVLLDELNSDWRD